MRFVGIHLILLLSCLSTGCNGSRGRISTPRINPEHAAKLAIQELDGDGDGLLSKNELKACPALVHAMGVYDSDRDGDLTTDEIATGIARWASSRTGAILLPFRIHLDGKQLADAKVKLVPVSFLENAVKPAEGIADSRGAGMLGLAPEDRPSNAPNVPLVPPGLYRVEITHANREIPAKYNSQSKLGLETSVAARNPVGVVWDLRSKKK